MQLPKDSLAGRVVLIVDHDPMSRDILRIFFKNLGATVLEADGHHDCFPVIDGNLLHAVIVEPYWPGLDSAHFLDRLRSACKPGVRVIVTTSDIAITQKEDLAVHEVFLKPFQIVEVAKSIIS